MTQIAQSSPRVARTPRPPFASHSRFVATAKRLLPLIALGLLGLVVIWPRLEINFQHWRAVPHVNPSLAHDLRMLHARYSGVDRANRPYVITADAVQQLSDNLNDLVGLEGPKADLTASNGGWIEVASYTGTYQPKSQLLDLFGHVSLYSDRGDEFHTDTARVNLANNSADSNDRVTGQGPFGHVTAQGLRVRDRGATVIFTGHTDLVLEPGATKAAK